MGEGDSVPEDQAPVVLVGKGRYVGLGGGKLHELRLNVGEGD